MTTEIKIWQSFSCNNSSDFRLVARFGDAKIAAEAAEELRAFFKAHAKEGDKVLEEHFSTENAGWPPPNTKVSEAFGAKHGFKWKEWLGWGDGGLVGDEPKAVATDKTLVVYHDYCGDLSGDINTYLKKRGATKVEEDEDAPSISVLFSLPTGPSGKKLADSLAKIFRQAEDTEYIDEWKTKPPWTRGDQPDDESKNVAFFSDGKTLGFFLPIDPGHLDKLQKYLEKSGVKNPSLRLCEPGDLKKYKTIAGAKCSACGSAPLRYVDPRTHNIESEQLACDKCGGMYDLAAMKPPRAKKKAPPPEPEPVKKVATKKKAATKAKTKTKTKAKKKSGAKKK